MKITVIFFCLLFSFFSFAQEISETLIIDQEINFCQPGVINKSPGKGLMLDYRIRPDFKFSGKEIQDSPVENNIRFNSKLKIPVFIKPGFKLLIGFQYMIERYNFDDLNANNFPLFTAIDNQNLRTSRVSVYISKPFNERFYSSFRLGVSYSGDYEKFATTDNRYATYRAVGVLGFKKSENLEFGGGIMSSYGFRNATNLPIPFLFVNHTYNDRWGIEFAIPISLKLRHNIKDGSLLLFGPQFRSRNYSLDIPSFIRENNDIIHFRRAAVETSLTYQQRVKSWIWVEANMGYNFNFKTEIVNTTTNLERKLTESNGIVGSVGIFLSPPAKNKICEDKKH